ncbi:MULTISPECIES: hypothetical protein [unclassified Variovorax]|uniref:hypothetical protein n=1 Tax=unclassified Variovorax TaxID=663243 RepID=UPI003F448A8D
MDVIQSSNKQVDKFGVGLHGFQPGNPTLGVLATYFSNDWADAIQQELINIILAAGIAKSGADLTQVLKAIRSNALLTATDTGAANAAVLTFAPAIPALVDGMVLWFKAVATNTGPTTLNVNALGAKAVVGGSHAALQGGEIVADGKCMVVWNTALNSFVLVECTGAALQVGAATKSLHAVQLGQITGRLVGLSVFPGSAVWTRGPTTKFVVSEIYGAGGGGGGTAATGAGQIAAAGGGGGGGYSMKLVATPGATEVVSLGAAGAGTSGNGIGGTGGTSSFGSWHTATGGSGGGGCPSGAQGNVAGGAGGVGVGGDVNLRGGAGGSSFAATATGALGGVSGYGGTTAKGSGGVAGITGTSAGAAGATGGGGGAGAFGYNGAGQQGGGSGSGGYAIIWEYA